MPAPLAHRELRLPTAEDRTVDAFSSVRVPRSSRVGSIFLMDLIYWTNIPAPYTVERLNSLAKRGNLTFEAWFAARIEHNRSWTVREEDWEFSYRYLPSVSVKTHHLALPLPLLRGVVPRLFLGLHADPSFLLSQLLLRRRGTRSVFWVTTTFDSWIRRRWWKEAMKRYVFPRIDAVLTTGGDGRAFAMRYGVDGRRIFVLPHFVDFEYFEARHRSLFPCRECIRATLGVSGVTFCYVGRLWRGKGIDYLLDAFRELERRHGDGVSLLLVGDGPAAARLRQRCRDEQIRRVVFTGFRQRDDLPEIYTASDVFVFPTLGDPFGHVVEEAMTSSLPVIATTAAGEIRTRVEEGRSGFIVPPADSAALLERMELLTTHAGLRRRMGLRSAEMPAGQTSEHWAREFERVVAQILSLPPNR
jgi:glycosyltransferase involved in cell wall biosynthesis